MNTEAFVPDWHGAASDLIGAFVQFHDMEDRLRILEKLCVSLEDNLYPAFLQILLMVERHGDSESKALVSETLAYAVSIQRLPVGKMSAWGSSSTPGNSTFNSFRRLGPLEYLCSWYAQPSALQPLSASAFRTALTGLLSLINSCKAGSEMYQMKILSDSDDPLSGALTGQTRSGLRELVLHWQQDQPPEKCIDAFLDSIGNQQSLGNLGSNPFA
jgi:hypothetical protein